MTDAGDVHEVWMRRALDLARAQRGRTGDNPSVGCVIVKNGVVVGEGATRDGGRPHAEEVALLMAGEDARDATAYVTLEPCARRSHGGVCCAELLGGARIARLWVATTDPHPNAAGAGLDMLFGIGMPIEMGLLEAEAREINRGFFESVGRMISTRDVET